MLRSWSVVAMALGIRPLAQDRLYERLRDGACGRCAEAGLVLERDRDGDLGILRRRERDEPRVVLAVDAGLGGAGLAGELDSGDLDVRRSTTGHDRLHHLR